MTRRTAIALVGTLSLSAVATRYGQVGDASADDPKPPTVLAQYFKAEPA
ncbi:hypothetical protein ACWGII_00540 [Streptomyces sp. NPDC054855]